jgi:hypothetical protein
MAKFNDDIEVATQTIAKNVTFFDDLGIKTVAGRNFCAYALANALLMDRKQQDYGPRNISGFGTFGILVRMNDKLERLKTLFGKGRSRKRARNESVEDTLRDVSNYAIIALLVEKGKWPNE